MTSNSYLPNKILIFGSEIPIYVWVSHSIFKYEVSSDFKCRVSFGATFMFNGVRNDLRTHSTIIKRTHFQDQIGTTTLDELNLKSLSRFKIRIGSKGCLNFNTVWRLLTINELNIEHRRRSVISRIYVNSDKWTTKRFFNFVWFMDSGLNTFLNWLENKSDLIWDALVPFLFIKRNISVQPM